MKRILVINADDLGYTRGVNRAVSRCSTEGMLRNTTLMANGSAFLDAVVRTRNMQAPAGPLAIGAHLVLTELSSVAGPEEIPGLVDDLGRLPRSIGQLFAALSAGRITRKSLFKELDQQVAKLIDHGIRPTHLDGHKHVHVLPQVLDVVIEIAKKYSIKWIRQPFDRTPFPRMFRAVDPSNRGAFCEQHLKSRLIEIYRPTFLRRLKLAGICTPDHFYGISLTGIWNDKAMAQLVRQLPPGTSECMLHPGDCDRELLEHRTRLREVREVERDLLLSPLLKSLLAKHGVTLKCYGKSV